MPIKRCIKCGEEKESKEFPKRKLSKDGFRNDCKKCYNKQKKEWAENNPEKRKKSSKKYCENNKEKIKENWQKWYKNNKKKHREWAINNPEKVKECNKKYYQNNKEKINGRCKKYRQNNWDKIKKYLCDRKKINIHFKIKSNISSLIYNRLKFRLSSKNGKLTWSFLPYTVDDLIKHLESLFEPWMNWSNYGKGKGKWVIDHRHPDSLFYYTSVEDEEFQKCWALSNLQPMEYIENIKKGKKVQTN